MRHRCRRCRHFLKATYHHLFCRSCKIAINKAKREVHKIADKGKCWICLKSGPLFQCKKFTLDGKKMRDSTIACGVCRDGFLKRLGYVEVK